MERSLNASHSLIDGLFETVSECCKSTAARQRRKHAKTMRCRVCYDLITALPPGLHGMQAAENRPATFICRFSSMMWSGKFVECSKGFHESPPSAVRVARPTTP